MYSKSVFGEGGAGGDVIVAALPIYFHEQTH